MVLFLMLNVALSLIVSLAALARVAPHWRTPVAKWLLGILTGFSLWSFWVLATFWAPDFETKVFLTKVRQLTNPFIAPLWACIVIHVLDPIFWRQKKKTLLVLGILPAITSVCTALSILEIGGVETAVAHGFSEMGPGIGLLTYKAGPLLRVLFAHNIVVIVLLQGLCLAGLFMRDPRKRRYAVVFSSTAMIFIGLELAAQMSKDSLYIQTMAGNTWFVAAGWLYGISRLGFFGFARASS